MLTSSDGSAWSDRSPHSTTNYLSSVGYGNGVFVAVGSNGTILRSSDGVTWNVLCSGTGYVWPNGRKINNIDSTPEPPAAFVFKNKLYVFWKANDPGNSIYYSASADGVTWPNGR